MDSANHDELRGASSTGPLKGAQIIHQELLDEGFDEETAFWATAAADVLVSDSE